MELRDERQAREYPEKSFRASRRITRLPGASVAGRSGTTTSLQSIKRMINQMTLRKSSATNRGRRPSHSSQKQTALPPPHPPPPPRHPCPSPSLPLVLSIQMSQRVPCLAFTPSHRSDARSVGSIAIEDTETTEKRRRFKSSLCVLCVLCGYFFPGFNSVSADSSTINPADYSENAASITGTRASRRGSNYVMSSVIAWKPAAFTPELASALRCYRPLQYLNNAGWSCELFDQCRWTGIAPSSSRKRMARRPRDRRSLAATRRADRFRPVRQPFLNDERPNPERADRLRRMIDGVDAVSASTPELAKPVDRHATSSTMRWTR